MWQGLPELLTNCICEREQAVVQCSQSLNWNFYPQDDSAQEVGTQHPQTQPPATSVASCTSYTRPGGTPCPHPYCLKAPLLHSGSACCRATKHPYRPCWPLCCTVRAPVAGLRNTLRLLSAYSSTTSPEPLHSGHRDTACTYAGIYALLQMQVMQRPDTCDSGCNSIGKQAHTQNRVCWPHSDVQCVLWWTGGRHLHAH